MVGLEDCPSSGLCRKSNSHESVQHRAFSDSYAAGRKVKSYTANYCFWDTHHKGDVAVFWVEGPWLVWRTALDQMYPNAMPIHPAWHIRLKLFADHRMHSDTVSNAPARCTFIL
jgi:hypothetical protein